MVSPFRRRQAQAEVDRRRKERETYTVPVVAKPGRATAEGELVVSAEEVQEYKAFATEFYQKIYTKAYQAELDALLQQYPDDLGHFYTTLVEETKVVSVESFWQGYLYRCDVDRVLKEWERRPESGRQARAAALRAGRNNGSNDDNKKNNDNNERPLLRPKTSFSKKPSVSSSSVSSSSSSSTSSTKDNIARNRRADALRGEPSSNSKKGESISERFHRTAATNDNSKSVAASIDNESSGKPLKVIDKKSDISSDSDPTSTSWEKLRRVGRMLQKIVVGLALTALVLDYARRLGAGKVVCEALTQAPRLADRNLVDFLPPGLCNEKHAMVVVTGNDDDAPRVKRRAMGWGNRGDSNQQQYDDNAYYGGDDRTNSNSNNPLWNSWRKVAEQTVNQQQQGEYGGTGLAASGGGHGLDTHHGHQNEGIVGYFKDKFGRAGVVVEQHVVHHHVHHVIHEHR